MYNLSIIDGDLNNQLHANALIHLINEYMADPMGGELAHLTEQKSADLVEGLRSFPTAVILFCKYSEEIIGGAVSFIGYSTFYAKPLLNVHDLIVFTEYRKKGAGKLLLESCISKASSLGCCKVTLEVRTDNASAKRLYSQLGFSAGENPMEFWTRMF